MGDRHDYVALDWVKGEISETLNQARQALEAYVENPGDTTRLRFCLTYIHQVHGTLQMVEFYGAALLAEEMEKLAQALMHGSCSRQSEALEVLMQAILQMPAYLDRVQSARRDMPLLLLPLLNDMRTARGESLLTETAVFNPRLKAGQPQPSEAVADFASDAVILQLRKLRQAMQITHAAIIRGQDVERNSHQMARVFDRLQQLCEGTRFAELWAVFAGVAEGLEQGSIENGPAIRQLLRLGDRELRELLEDTASISTREPNPELLRNLLFYVAKSAADTPRLSALRDHYQLAGVWQEEPAADADIHSRLVGPDKGTMQSVAVALNEELLQVKERLDLFVRSTTRSQQDLLSLLPDMKRIADTLAVLGLGQPRRVLQEQIERVEQMTLANEPPTDAELMEIAGGMLYVEASMHGILAMERIASDGPAQGSQGSQLADAGEILQIQQQVVLEARNALEQTREAINAFIAAQWDFSLLEPVDELLNSIRGGLAMLPLERAANVVAACRLYIHRELFVRQRKPDWEALDTLADVISGIDYYLERVARDDIDRGEGILAAAEDCLAVLGYAPENLPALLEGAEQQDEQNPAPVEAAQPAAADGEVEDEDEIDPELLEIFVEEVGEVLETLDEYTPQWQADPDNKAARTEVRRGFHTLKGSGRMVRAGILAELAWAVENMLNRVIDGNVEASPAVFAVVNAVRGLMPGLLDDFANGRAAPSPVVDRLAMQAEILSRGEMPAEPITLDAPQAAPPEPLAESAEVESSPELADESDGMEEVGVLPEAIELAPEEQEVADEFAAAWQDQDDVVEFEITGLPEADVQVYSEDDFDFGLLDEPQPADEALPDQTLEPILLEPLDPALAEPEETLPEHPEELELPEPEIPPQAEPEPEPEPELPVAAVEEYRPDANAEEPASAELDPLLLKIFRTETEVHIGQVRGFLEKCEQSLPQPLSDALQRALHTLKGSAHMAGIQPVAQLATPLEKLAKDFKTNLIPADRPLALLLGDAADRLEHWLEQGDASQPITGSEELLARLDTLYRQAMEERESSRAQLEGGNDTDLLSIFLTDGIELLLDASDELAEGGSIDHAALARALRALAEVAQDVDLRPIEELCQGLEDVHEALVGQRLPFSDDVASSLAQGHERLIAMMDQVAAHQHVQSASGELQLLQELFSQPLDTPAPALDTPMEQAPADRGPAAATAGQWDPTDAGTDDELVEIFLEEAQEILDSAAGSLQQWLAEPAEEAPLHALLRDLHTLKGGARMAEIRPVGDLAHELEFLYEGLVGGRFQLVEGLPALLMACQDSLAEMVEGILAGRSISDGMGLIRAIRDFRAAPDQPPRLPAEDVQEAPAAASVAPEPSELMTATPAPATVPGMLGMFIEEARELLQPCAELIGRLQDDPQASSELLHRLQTLKGSARLADQQSLAEQARRLEQALHQAGPDQLQRDLSQLLGDVERLAQGSEQLEWERPVPAAPRPADSAGTPPLPAGEGRTLADVRQILREAMGVGQEAAGPSRAGVQETVKVPAALLEELVNLAGETSIFRGRVEQQVSDISHTLNDMESTIERVRDQLRRLDMETQAQILSRHQEEIEQGYEDFDPLEMDRYSQLQQLSRSLFESASDMLDLKETLATRSRDAETLLLQQARVNTELQEGLMRTRMVPFERLLPRLRRVVRQVSTEVGKQVELVVANAEGEMDRSVLERMMSPLEHMLRNAVDHGIETPEQRAQQGKPAEGRISLELEREGGEILLRLSDDGRGIDLDAVRRKAIERGLMDADASLSDQEILQFILEAGFSTAAQVTQISGRGVGMDVVNSEIKQLGGSMTLTTEPGRGTTFIIRLPFTVSVNRALMVYSGDDLYAIPLNTIEGIVRVSGYELEAYYAPGAPPFEYAGKHYDLRYLGDLLATGQQPKLSGHSLPLPVILVRGAEHSIAVQVDSLAGSREIVVKNLGKQFAVVSGISGATILGDGRVVVILDLLAVIRAQQAHAQHQQHIEQPAVAEDRATLVMVVDDSITVRKVTSRLLERHGMEVVTAKDGVDAIAQLQDLQPDIMLLDIEMPRMDGFEVATLVRHDERLQDLPIIMITSRTGEKHRERARSLGVNEYLGKPYQEAQLLELIDGLVGPGD